MLKQCYSYWFLLDLWWSHEHHTDSYSWSKRPLECIKMHHFKKRTYKNFSNPLQTTFLATGLQTITRSSKLSASKRRWVFLWDSMEVWRIVRTSVGDQTGSFLVRRETVSHHHARQQRAGFTADKLMPLAGKGYINVPTCVYKLLFYCTQSLFSW